MSLHDGGRRRVRSQLLTLPSPETFLLHMTAPEPAAVGPLLPRLWVATAYCARYPAPRNRIPKIPCFPRRGAPRGTKCLVSLLIGPVERAGLANFETQGYMVRAHCTPYVATNAAYGRNGMPGAFVVIQRLLVVSVPSSAKIPSDGPQAGGQMQDTKAWVRDL